MGKKRRGGSSAVGSKNDPSSKQGTGASSARGKVDGGVDDRARFLFDVLVIVFVLPAVLTAVAFVFGLSPALKSPSEGDVRPHFLARLVLSLLLDATYGGAFSTLLIPASRSLARLLPGASVPDDRAGCERQEGEQNDTSLAWPIPGTDLPPDWVAAALGRKKGEQPFFLNHVRGSTRLRQAAQRIANALGTLSMVAAMSYLVDGNSMHYIGLDLSLQDIVAGFVVGTVSVLALFLAELALGWIRIIGFGEVVVPGESLPINLTWDVLFHAGVSLNEEISLRGWVLVHAAAYFASLGAPPATAMLVSASMQAGMFALLHLGSPGASLVGLVNLVVGGSAAALNVVLSGGLSFPLGWHFGWNIFMGHLLGMSTSGIPMSAKLISVLPHPAKSHLHGGKFGPEQSPLAPVAYLLGCACLVALYGMDGMEAWRERLNVALPGE
uniref:Uncharacterized protein n=1 Tax=Odontella aurita TaxID=265563 RepID=A0A7S4ID27_9STRA|mmetsp:Transcript_23215/g.68628  ORF Transcript_23215/g.68628 Transcript_23215/m.68628 type:complete len:440 (+) Transcript_23215:207-1526(+)|eukprot:CAMPEP_0113545532 /NCGR_PEP_ID=MMETSP0015_2-20120614/11311_1 /TAXON_ID=2838 /ORGANISM="Odontella" /LENGTH=439 /DNA_ID=CAMNT_0000445903 /DNA_START=103 /DNA_END=1422 /DNA_ORIENTATION=+ /assembly_acc=CAM_ASM_000160